MQIRKPKSKSDTGNHRDLNDPNYYIDKNIIISFPYGIHIRLPVPFTTLKLIEKVYTITRPMTNMNSKNGEKMLLTTEYSSLSKPPTTLRHSTTILLRPIITLMYWKTMKNLLLL